MELVPDNAVSAIITTPDGRYLLQHRDDIPGIWFPGHWGLFGGAIDPGERPKDALTREISEELGLNRLADDFDYFTRYEFDFRYAGHDVVFRSFYRLQISFDDLDAMILGEGQDTGLFHETDLLDGLKLTPYDHFALWMHINRPNAGTPQQPYR